MNILFLTISEFNGLEKNDIYGDLLVELKKSGHNVYLVSSIQKRSNIMTNYKIIDGVNCLSVRTGNITKCGIIEKGVSTLCISRQYKKAIKKYFDNINFDIVVYPTPPITLYSVVSFVKKKYNSYSYLMLKDIFPQNAIDIGILSKKGIKGLIYKMFKTKECKIYNISDKIGCMSEENIKYLLKNNDYINKDKVELFPNCVTPLDLSLSNDEKVELRHKYNLSLEKFIYVYGGNLGKPQSVDFIIECCDKIKNNDKIEILIVGSGTEDYKIKEYLKNNNNNNLKYISQIPKEEYNKVVACCDVGLIFLDYRFTIPNFPSRVLSYTQSKIPVICCTDRNTDIGTIAQDNQFGWSCLSNNPESFIKCIDESLKSDLVAMGENGFNYMLENWNVSKEIFKILKVSK